MKLRDVMLCLDCDEVFVQEVVHFLDQKVKIDYCPVCGNQQLFRVSKWLSTMNQKNCDCMYNGKTPPYQCDITEENKCKTKGSPVEAGTALKGN